MLQDTKIKSGSQYNTTLEFYLYVTDATDVSYCEPGLTLLQCHIIVNQEKKVHFYI